MWRSLILILGIYIVFPTNAVFDNYLNESVNPCDNFYQYACGSWSNVNVNLEHGDTLSLLDEDLNRKIAGFLESNRRRHRSVQKMKTFYRSCKNTKNYRVDRFLDRVKPKGGWAIKKGAWKAKQFNWLDTVAEVRKYGAQVFFEHTVMPKWDDSSVDIMYLDVIKVHPNNEFHFLNYLRQTSVNESAVDSLAEELMQFEQHLIKITSSKPESEENDGEMVLGFLNEALPLVNWVKYLSIVSGKEVPLTTRVIAQNTEIMSRLAEFLNGSEARLVCHYIMVKFLQFMDQYSISEVSSNECITTLHQSMPFAVGYVIEYNFYNRENDQAIRDLFNHLKSSFLDVTQELYPTQQDVLHFLQTKVHSMDLQIGNARRNLTVNDVGKYYDGLRFGDDFYTNLLRAFKWKVDKELKSLSGVLVDVAYQWIVTPSPFFLQPTNRIVVPLSLLQDSTMTKDMTRRSAVLGFIIGHEFLHGFDQNGVNYDYQGSMVDSPLSTSSVFLERIGCLKDLATGNMGEKIADLGGVRLAYRAYKKISNSSAEKLQGGRSGEQEFFIDFVQFFCEVNQEEAKIPDTHGTNELRVLQTLMHFEDFSSAFGCPVGSAMNPERKCRVW